eukprot:4661467-Prymnesium_polylepis.1
MASKRAGRARTTKGCHTLFHCAVAAPVRGGPSCSVCHAPNLGGRCRRAESAGILPPQGWVPETYIGRQPSSGRPGT